MPEFLNMEDHHYYPTSAESKIDKYKKPRFYCDLCTEDFYRQCDQVPYGGALDLFLKSKPNAGRCWNDT